jgi:hypothetical protein
MLTRHNFRGMNVITQTPTRSARTALKEFQSVEGIDLGFWVKAFVAIAPRTSQYKNNYVKSVVFAKAEYRDGREKIKCTLTIGAYGSTDKRYECIQGTPNWRRLKG